MSGVPRANVDPSGHTSLPDRMLKFFHPEQPYPDELKDLMTQLCYAMENKRPPQTPALVSLLNAISEKQARLSADPNDRHILVVRTEFEEQDDGQFVEVSRVQLQLLPPRPPSTTPHHPQHPQHVQPQQTFTPATAQTPTLPTTTAASTAGTTRRTGWATTAVDRTVGPPISPRSMKRKQERWMPHSAKDDKSKGEYCQWYESSPPKKRKVEVKVKEAEDVAKKDGVQGSSSKKGKGKAKATAQDNGSATTTQVGPSNSSASRLTKGPSTKSGPKATPSQTVSKAPAVGSSTTTRSLRSSQLPTATRSLRSSQPSNAKDTTESQGVKGSQPSTTTRSLRSSQPSNAKDSTTSQAVKGSKPSTIARSLRSSQPPTATRSLRSSQPPNAKDTTASQAVKDSQPSTITRSLRSSQPSNAKDTTTSQAVKGSTAIAIPAPTTPTNVSKKNISRSQGRTEVNIPHRSPHKPASLAVMSQESPIRLTRNRKRGITASPKVQVRASTPALTIGTTSRESSVYSGAHGVKSSALTALGVGVAAPILAGDAAVFATPPRSKNRNITNTKNVYKSPEPFVSKIPLSALEVEEFDFSGLFSDNEDDQDGDQELEKEVPAVFETLNKPITVAAQNKEEAAEEEVEIEEKEEVDEEVEVEASVDGDALSKELELGMLELLGDEDGKDTEQEQDGSSDKNESDDDSSEESDSESSSESSTSEDED